MGKGLGEGGDKCNFSVEQNAHLALKAANRGYVMETGSITLADSAENLLSNEEVKKAYLGL